jgi:hypothetical protein
MTERTRRASPTRGERYANGCRAARASTAAAPSHRCLPRMPLGHCCDDQHERKHDYQNAEQRPGTPPLCPEVRDKVAPPAQRAGKTKVRLVTPKARSMLEFLVLTVTSAIAIGRR